MTNETEVGSEREKERGREREGGWSRHAVQGEGPDPRRGVWPN